MKRKLLKSFSIIAAFITTIPIVNAAAPNYKFSAPTQEWKTTLTAPKGAVIGSYPEAYIQAAASDERIYTIPGSTTEAVYPTISNTNTDHYTQGYYLGDGTQNYWSGGDSDAAMPYQNITNATYYYLGSCIASDDAGTLWCSSRKTTTGPKEAPYAVGARGFTYYTVRPGGSSSAVRTGINLYSSNLHTSGRADIMSVYGNGLYGTAHFWFAIGNTNTAECIIMTEKKAKKKLSFETPMDNNNRTYVKQFATDRLIYNPGGTGTATNDIYLGTISGSLSDGTASVSWENTGLKVCRYGSTAFVLRGHGIIVYSSSPTTISLYDWTAQRDLGSFSPFNSASSNNYVSHSMDVKIVDSNTVALYVYVPGQGGAKYLISASAINDPVTNVSANLVSGSKNSVNVSWGMPTQGNPEKYSVSYSSDGGSTWSTAIETTELSYTYTNLADGTYLFKVTPYYSDTNVWGGEAKSSSIDVEYAKYTPITKLDYQYTLNSSGRQDIKLTWDAPTGYENTSVTGYKVYRGTTLLATLGADILTYTNTGVTQNYTYKVVPLFDGLGEDSSLGTEITVTEVSTILVAPEISEVRNYEGLSLVELFYKMPSYTPYKPLYYNLYRDGKLIQSKLQSYNTLDESLVRSSQPTTVKYQVEAVYGNAADTYPAIDSIKCAEYSVTIAPRDWAKTGYILQEVYNIPVNEIATDKKPNLFDNNDYYRQGQFHDGKWYIAQRANNLSKHDQGIEGGGQIASDIEGTTGGVVVFAATDSVDIMAGMEAKIITKPEFENVGIAMDDAGTIFVRNNNFDKLKATVPTGHGTETAWGWMTDAFERRITEGTLYKRNSDGTYTESKTIDLTRLWTDDSWIDKMHYDGLDSNGQVIGRSDNYHMWGDVLGDGGYLILSPSWTRTAFKVFIADGEYKSHEVIEFNEYTHPSGNYTLTPKTGTENYGFHLDGREHAWTAQIRSNGYYGVHSEDEGLSWHPIFTADSRINNAGGTSIQAFGKIVEQEDIDQGKYAQDDLGRHTGELFVITPQSMHSRNVGDFLISRATKENSTDFADEGSLMPSTPVVQYVQTDARSNSTATNANGNWFHAEIGTYASAMNDADECVDIYQYVPGTRFARYRLVPSNQFPQVQPTLNITTAYNDDKTEITHFDGVATWKRPTGFGRSTGSANAKVHSYLFEMYNSKNELVAEAELPELYTTEGEPVSDDYVYDFDYNDTTSNVDIDFGRYSVSVRVKYQTKDGAFHISDPLYAEAIHEYPAEPAEDTYVKVFGLKNYTSYDEDGNASQNDAYRVEIDFNPPSWDEYDDGVSEPVSYYTIKAIVNRSTTNDTINIKDFALHKGSYTQGGKLWATTEVTSQIPGTYDFSKSKAPYYTTITDTENGTGLYNGSADGGSFRNVVLSWFHIVPTGTYDNAVAVASNGDEVVITDSPDKWTFIIEAHYAARNSYIALNRTADVSTDGQLIPTGAEEISNGNASAIVVYPNPTSSLLTIKSPVSINSIVVYNEAGVEMMATDCNSETTVVINLEDLATGHYFVKVNNNTPVKVIKN